MNRNIAVLRYIRLCDLYSYEIRIAKPVSVSNHLPERYFDPMKCMIRTQLAILIVFLGLPLVSGQEFTAGSGSGAAGGTVNITATLNNNGEGPVQGWSYGMCHDSAIASVSLIHEEQSAGVDFNQTSIYVDGWTQGVVISFTGQNPIEPGAPDFTMASADYTIDAAALPGSTSLNFCDSLGTPPVTTVAVVGGASITPAQNPGNLTVIEIPDPEYIYAAPDRIVNYNPDDGTGAFTEQILVTEVDNSAAGTAFPNETQGFSMGLAHDASLLEATSVTLSGPVAGLAGGDGPGFAESSIYPDGWTLGIVYSFVGAETIAFSSTESVAEIGYQTIPAALVGNETGLTSSLNWTDTLGTPPVTNVMVVSGSSIAAILSDANLTFEPGVLAFLRADANHDLRVDIADVIWMLQEQFVTGPSNNCAEAKDANGDGIYNVADPTWVINYRFSEGPEPPAPFPDCGTIPGQTPEDCLEYPPCG